MKKVSFVLATVFACVLMWGGTVFATDVSRPPVVPRMPDGVQIALTHLRAQKADERLIFEVEENLSIALANGAGVKAVADIMEFVSLKADRPEVYAQVSERILLMAVKGKDVGEAARTLCEVPDGACPVRALLKAGLVRLNW